MLKTYMPSFVAITETWMTDHISDNFLDPNNNYIIYRQDRVLSRGGGVCLMIDKQIKSTPVTFSLELPGVELLCVDLIMRDELIRLVVCYRSTSLAHMSLDMNFKLVTCLDKLFRVKHKCILMGDLNLPKLNWNLDHIVINDPIHEMFYVNFCSFGLTQLNTIPTRNDAILDLVFSNDPGLISDVLTLPPIGASDHDVISFSIRLPARVPSSAHVEPVTARNYFKCNFDLMNSDLEQLDWNIVFQNCASVDELWSTFSNLLDKLLDVHCPLIVIHTNHARKPFHYPPSIKRLQAHKKRVWRRMRSD
jgi:hypothetical protein